MTQVLLAMLAQQARIDWQTDHAAALAKAKSEKKLAIVHFWADW
jgi:hypothetical protein